MSEIETEQEDTPLQEVRELVASVFRFVRVEVRGSFVLLLAAIVALFWANSPWSESYFELIHMKLGISLNGHALTDSVQHWINDGLMTLFFFLIGLEIKRELVTGRLRDRRTAVLPAMAALGGMAVPAALYALCAGGGPASHGWAVPMATDIAFALGILGLLARRAPPELRLFLLTLAIIDDIGCIAVIAVFYSKGISFAWLAAVVAVTFLVWFMRWFGFRGVWPYVPIGILVWYCALMSGVHASIAGVIVGLMTPAHPIGGRRVLENLEHGLHPWVSFAVIPLFAFANAGVNLNWSFVTDALSRQVTWGVFLALLFGKPLGIAGFTAIALRLRMGVLPEGIRMAHIWAMAPLGGIGFTVSLVIGALSFADPARLDAAKLGILAGSAVSACLGMALLSWLHRRNCKQATNTSGESLPS